MYETHRPSTPPTLWDRLVAADKEWHESNPVPPYHKYVPEQIADWWRVVGPFYRKHRSNADVGNSSRPN